MAASLLFAPGERPRGQAITALGEGAGGFSVSLDQAGGSYDGADWMELLASGLTYDVTGLAPGAAAGPPPIRHSYGLAGDLAGLEAITVRPGPHLAAGATMAPVVRMLASLAARLSVLPHLRAVVWHPARCCSAPDAFRGGVTRWVAGGPFPAFSLAALAEMPDDALQSEGLALFTGQELRIESALAPDKSTPARIAVRLLHWLVESGPLAAPKLIEGPDGELLRLEPSRDGAFVCVRGE